MLVKDYQHRLGLLIIVVQQIELPVGYENFFGESGSTSSVANDRRSTVRMRVRTSGILIPRRWLPAFPRRQRQDDLHEGFLKTGFGFVTHQQYFPGEHVRVILATFWMEIVIRRCRRLGPGCFEAGGILLERHDTSLEAFLDT